MRFQSFFIVLVMGLSMSFQSVVRADETSSGERLQIWGESEDSIAYHFRFISGEQALPSTLKGVTVRAIDQGRNGISLVVSVPRHQLEIGGRARSKVIPKQDYTIKIPPQSLGEGEKVNIFVGLDSGSLPYVDILPADRQSLHSIEREVEARNLKRLKEILGSRTANAISDAQDEILRNNQRRRHESCFYEGTCILVPGASKEIKDLKIGEVVLGYDHKNKVVVETVVRALRLGFNRSRVLMVADEHSLNLRSGSSMDNSLRDIRVVPSHQMFQLDSDNPYEQLPRGSYLPIFARTGDLSLAATSVHVLNSNELQAAGGVQRTRTSVWSSAFRLGMEESAGINQDSGFFSFAAKPVVNFTTGTQNYFCAGAVGELGVLAHNVKVEI